MNERTPPTSRRSRPAKPPLSREVIVAAALDLMARDGFSGLSLRRVAAELDTGAASLYVYVANLGHLHRLMLDAALGEMQLPEDGSAPWREAAMSLLLAYLQALHGRRGLARLAMTALAAGPGAMRIWERLLHLLRGAGMDGRRAAWGVDLLLLQATAIAAEQAGRDAGGLRPESIREEVEALPEERYPLVRAHADDLFSGGGLQRAAWALEVILDGLAAAPGVRPGLGETL